MVISIPDVGRVGNNIVIIMDRDNAEVFVEAINHLAKDTRRVSAVVTGIVSDIADIVADMDDED